MLTIMLPAQQPRMVQTMLLLARMNVIAMAFLIAGGCLRQLGDQDAEPFEGIPLFYVECKPKVKPTRVFKADNHYFTKIAFSPNGKFLAASGFGPDFFVWDFSNGKRLYTLCASDGGGIIDCMADLVFSCDSKLLFTANYAEAGIECWDLQTGQLQSRLNAENLTLGQIAVATKEKLLVTTGDNVAPLEITSNLFPKTIPNAICLWKGSPPKLESVIPGDENRFTTVAMNRDGRQIVTGNNKGVLAFWDSDTKQRTAAFQLYEGMVSCTSISPDGELLATFSYDDSVSIWKIKTLLELAKAGNSDLPNRQFSIKPLREYVPSIKWSPNGKYLAIVTYLPGDRQGGLTENISIWSTADGREIANLGTGKNGYGGTDIAFHPSGEFFATCHPGGTIRIWSFADLLKGKERQ